MWSSSHVVAVVDRHQSVVFEISTILRSPRIAVLVTPGALLARDAAQFHDRVVPDAGLAGRHQFSGRRLERHVVRNLEGAVIAAIYTIRPRTGDDSFGRVIRRVSCTSFA